VAWFRWHQLKDETTDTNTDPKRSKGGAPVILGEGAGCNCFFVFDYQISGLSPIAITSYLVNGRTFQENYNSALH
jgi:hypothetical protein